MTQTLTSNGQNALDAILAMFPWLKQLNIVDQLRQWAAEPNVTADGLVAQLRNSQQYKDAVPGMFREDGTMRMNEASYFTQQDQYRTLLQEWGRGTQEYNDPKDFQAFFENDMQPADLKQRLDTYDQVVHGSQDVKSAFYVYAGMKLTDDQLYAAVVNPTEKQKLNDEYNKRVALQPLDYQTWITRATEAGLDRVTSTLSNLQNQGVVTGDAIDAVRRTDPSFAKQIADQLYHGGSGTGPFLSLEQLLHSFQYALIGGAATQSGLDLPTTTRLDALRQAGVTSANAAQGYAYIAENKGVLQGALDRMQSGRQFGVADYEKALLLHSAPEEDLLNRAQASDKALTQAGGGAQVQAGQQGQLQQRGLGGRY